MSWSMTTFLNFVDPPSPIFKDKVLDPTWAELRPEKAEPTRDLYDLFVADKRVADHAYQMRHGSYYTNLHDYMDYALSAHLANFQLQLQ